MDNNWEFVRKIKQSKLYLTVMSNLGYCMNDSCKMMEEIKNKVQVLINKRLWRLSGV